MLEAISQTNLKFKAKTAIFSSYFILYTYVLLCSAFESHKLKGVTKSWAHLQINLNHENFIIEMTLYIICRRCFIQTSTQHNSYIYHKRAQSSPLQDLNISTFHLHCNRIDFYVPPATTNTLYLTVHHMKLQWLVLEAYNVMFLFSLMHIKKVYIIKISVTV